jgi:hypothetical protein
VTVKPLSGRGILAGHETRDAVLQVYMFLQDRSQISLYSLGGPKTIAQAGLATMMECPSCSCFSRY